MHQTPSPLTGHVRYPSPATPLPPKPATALVGLLDALEGRDLPGRSPDEALGDAITELVISATEPHALELGLAELRRRGRIGDLGSLLRALVACLPGRPATHARARPTPALRAMGRLVVLARDERQAAERFSAMIHAAIAEFNRGGIGRAGRIFDLAERLLGARRLDPRRVALLRASAHRQLDLERLRRLLGSPRQLPPALLRFFRVFEPELLLDCLARERGTRSELLLRLLEAHGPPARAIARRRLLGPRAHDADAPTLASLLLLLRRLAPGAAEPRELDEEVAAVAGLLTPEAPPLIVSEALTHLAHVAHPSAERALTLFLRELEGLLCETGSRGARRLRLVAALDETAAALARLGSSACRAALVAHGLRTEPVLGDCAARLGPLGAVDLGTTPELAGRLLDAVAESLPAGPLATLPPERERRLLRLAAALRTTLMPEVRELYQFLAARFPLRALGQQAARTLEAFDAQRTPLAASTSLSGDLRLFGLPALLQILADGGVTGVLTLGDACGPAVPTFVFEKGRLRSVRVGAAVGPGAVYQLLQRPFSGRFSFQHRQRVPSFNGERQRALGVHELILEGLRRCDELQRLAMRVPDDAAFEATGRPPSVANEWDIDLVTRLWERASAGASARDCEEALGADAWEVRRCLAHWLEDASLQNASTGLHGASAHGFPAGTVPG